MAQKYFDVISPVIAGQKKFEEQIPALTAILQEMIDLAKKQGDENNIISTYSSVFSFTATMKNFGQSADDMRPLILGVLRSGATFYKRATASPPTP